MADMPDLTVSEQPGDRINRVLYAFTNVVADVLTAADNGYIMPPFVVQSAKDAKAVLDEYNG